MPRFTTCIDCGAMVPKSPCVKCQKERDRTKNSTSFYQSPLWRRLRRECIARDRQCQVTGKTDSLAADHIIPRTQFGPDILENLWALDTQLHTQYTKDVLFDRDTPLRRQVDAARQQLIKQRGLRPVANY